MYHEFAIQPKENTRQFEKSLLVFGRKLVDEMRYINYPKEWSRKPLIDLVPLFVELLDYHPERLGSVLGVAISDEEFTPSRIDSASVTRDNIHLATSHSALEYSLYEYEMKLRPKEANIIEDAKIETLLKKIVSHIHRTFTELTALQENEHRTLERICFALTSVLRHVYGLHEPENNLHEPSYVGWDMLKYADRWRTLTATERKNFAKENNLLI